MLSINEKFKRIKKLGQGSFGIVWQVQEKPNGQTTALKVTKLDESYDLQKARREVDNVHKICKACPDDPRQIHIVQVTNDWEVSDPRDPEIRNWIDELWLNKLPPVYRLLVIQMEFCDNQSLDMWLRNPQTNQKLYEGSKFFYQITQGLSFLHDQNCIHRDLKPDNILLTKVDDRGRQVVVAKIGDFGSSRIRLPNSHSNLTYGVGADVYTSPEQINRRKNPAGYFEDYTTKSDIFSLGIIFFCIHYPIKKTFGPEALQYYGHLKGFSEVETKIPQDFTAKFPKETKLLRRMLSNDPEGRPTTHEIISIFLSFHVDLSWKIGGSDPSASYEEVTEMEWDPQTTAHSSLVNPRPEVMKYQMENFGEPEKIELLTFINQKSNSDQFLLNLDIKFVSDYKTLMSFLEQTATNKSVKINLKVDTIESSAVYEPPESTIKFNQLISLNFESLAAETQLLCLVEIVKNSPNLRQLSVGHFAYRLLSPKNISANMSKFLRMVSLQNLEFSCGFLGHSEMTKELFAQLKGRGVTVKKLGFTWTINPHQSEILDLVEGDVEEIHNLYHLTETPTFQCRLNNLKILGIWCGYEFLLEILKKTPNVEKIFFYISNSSLPVNVQISLPKLTCLSVCMNYNKNPEHIAKFFANCTNLSRLTCINRANAPMAEFYKNFGRIKKFRYLENGGVSMDNIVGMETSALTTQHLNGWMQDRPPYIGHLKELTSLSFGYKDYQWSSVVANWDLDMKAFSDGIGHLQKLEKICFSPMALQHAKNILTFLTSSSGTRQLKLVKLQVWEGKNAGKDGTMKTTDVEKLAREHRFKIEAKPLRPADQNRACHF